MTCQAIPKDDDPPGTVPPVSQHCVDQLTKVPVRVLLRADGDGVRLTVVVGPDRLELSSFVVHSDLLAVEMDLPRSYKAAQYVDQTLGTDSPMDTTRFETLAGRIRLSLHKDGEKKVTFAESVLEPVHIATVDASGALGPDVEDRRQRSHRGGDGRRRGPGPDGQARREPSKSLAPGTPKGAGRPTATCAWRLDLSPDRRRSPKVTIASWPRGSGSDRYPWTCAMRACSSWGLTPPT